MKLALAKRIVFLATLLILTGSQNQAQTLIDTDGNTYNSTTFGTQIWMSEDLKVTHYRNGDPIPRVTDETKWSNLSSGAYCNYNNDTNKTTLYNWFSIADSRTIAPIGWHVPTDSEWTILISFLGGDSVAGSKLQRHTFIATGSRNAKGGFEYPDYGDWWAYTGSGTTKGCHRGHPNGVAAIYNVSFDKKYGFAVRCIKDKAINK